MLIDTGADLTNPVPRVRWGHSAPPGLPFPRKPTAPPPRPRASQSAPGFSNTLSQSAMTLNHPTEKPSPDGMEAALRHQLDAARARFDIMNDPRLLMEDRESLIRAQETLLFEQRHALVCALHRAGDRAALRLLLDIPDWADAALDTGMYYTPGRGWISLDQGSAGAFFDGQSSRG